MSFRLSRVLMWIGFIIGIIVALIGKKFSSSDAMAGFMVASIIIFAISLIQAIIFYRCPHCGYSLMNVRGFIPEHCPKCGEKL